MLHNNAKFNFFALPPTTLLRGGGRNTLQTMSKSIFDNLNNMCKSRLIIRSSLKLCRRGETFGTPRGKLFRNKCQMRWKQ